MNSHQPPDTPAPGDVNVDDPTGGEADTGVVAPPQRLTDRAAQKDEDLGSLNSPEYARRYGDESVVIVGLALGLKLDDIAHASGFSTSSVQRRKNMPRIKAQVAELQKEKMRSMLGRTLALQGPSLTVMEDLLQAQSEWVRFRAADSLMRTFIKLGSDLDIRDQLDELSLELDQLRGHLAPAQPSRSDDPLAGLLDETDTDGENVEDIDARSTTSRSTASRRPGRRPVKDRGGGDAGGDT